MSELKIVSMAHALASHAAERQSLVASNIANADTPGYKAGDLLSFTDALEDGAALRATREGHLGWEETTPPARRIDRPGQPSPNGNTVSLEMELMTAAEIRQQHDMALSIYSSTRDILSTALGRGR